MCVCFIATGHCGALRCVVPLRLRRRYVSSYDSRIVLFYNNYTLIAGVLCPFAFASFWSLCLSAYLSISVITRVTTVWGHAGFAGPLCEMDIDECASVRRNSTPFAVQSFSLHLASSLSRQMITHFYVRNEILFSLTQMSLKTRLVFCTLHTQKDPCAPPKHCLESGSTSTDSGYDGEATAADAYRCVCPAGFSGAFLLLQLFQRFLGRSQLDAKR